MVQEVQELRMDLQELQEFHSKALRPSVKSYLQLEVSRLTQKISELDKPKADDCKDESVAPKRYITELNTYAWDQSDKFVKIFITLDGIQTVENAEQNVVAEINEKSLIVTIRNFKDKDYSFTVNNLLQEIVVDKSYRKVKTDMIAIYLKKAIEGHNWSHLTATARQLKDMKDQMYKEDPSKDPSDPTNSLMGLMKKMYETGTPEIKQTIAKAWQEGEEKRRRGEV